ncbi:MAG: MarR family transcriptional regulator [Thermomicrobiales bacterium]
MTSDMPETLLPDDLQKSEVIRQIKVTMDDMLWRSFLLGSRALRQYELTLQQALALGAIVRLGPDVDMGQLSETTMLAPSTMTSVVDRLLKRDLVNRYAHPTDRRRVLVSATRNGTYLYNEMDEQDLKAFAWQARGISMPDLEVVLQAFRHLLGEIETITPEDFEPGGRYARKESPLADVEDAGFAGT